MVDAVVVETRGAAMECVRYLRDQRLPAMTFLPLDGLRDQRPDERLRALGPASGAAS